MAILVQSNKKPSVSFPEQTGSIVTFNSQYAGLPLKAHTVDIDSVSGVSAINIGNCDSETASLWTIDNSFNGDVEFNQLIPTENKDYTNNNIDTRKNLDFSIISITSPIQSYIYQIVTSIGKLNLMFKPSIVTQGVRIKHNGALRDLFIYNSTTKTLSANHVYLVDVVCDGINPTVVGGIDLKNLQLFDLTQIFGSTIADYIYNLEQGEAGAGISFFKHIYPDNYYPYNAGTKQGVGTYTTINIGQTVNEGEYDARTGILEVTSPTEQTLQLSPCPIDTLQGMNNIWADTGDTTVQYIKIGG